MLMFDVWYADIMYDKKHYNEEGFLTWYYSFKNTLLYAHTIMFLLLNSVTFANDFCCFCNRNHSLISVALQSVLV